MPLENFISVVDEASLAATLKKQRHTLLVYTSADCVMCKRVYPALNGMSVALAFLALLHAILSPRFPSSIIRRFNQDQFNSVSFAVCSVDGAPGEERLAVLHDIQLLPTCILFEGALEVARVAGCTHKRPGKPVYDMLCQALHNA
jgi:hypothetical protein